MNWEMPVEERRRRWIDQVAKQPGGRAVVLRMLFQRREREVRAAIEATSDEGERAQLTANADELKRLAATVQAEAKEYEAMQTAKQIRDKAVARLRAIAQEMAALPDRVEGDDVAHSPQQVRLLKARNDLRQRWRIAEEQAFAEMGVWVASSMADAQALYDSDPIGDAATESRRVADELAIVNLATPLVGQPQTMVRNRLLSEAKRLIASNAADRARVYVEAARRAGVTDGKLDHALNEAFDRTVPHRRQAKALMEEIGLQRDLLRNDVYSERLIHNVGSRSEQASTSAAIKMGAFWEQQRALAAKEGGAE